MIRVTASSSYGLRMAVPKAFPSIRYFSAVASHNKIYEVVGGHPEVRVDLKTMNIFNRNLVFIWDNNHFLSKGLGRSLAENATKGHFAYFSEGLTIHTKQVVYGDSPLIFPLDEVPSYLLTTYVYGFCFFANNFQSGIFHMRIQFILDLVTTPEIRTIWEKIKDQSFENHEEDRLQIQKFLEEGSSTSEKRAFIVSHMQKSLSSHETKELWENLFRKVIIELLRNYPDQIKTKTLTLLSNPQDFHAQKAFSDEVNIIHRTQCMAKTFKRSISMVPRDLSTALLMGSLHQIVFYKSLLNHQL